MQKLKPFSSLSSSHLIFNLQANISANSFLLRDNLDSYKYIFKFKYFYNWAALLAQTVKHLPVRKETWVLSLGQDDSLGKKMSTYSSVLAWIIPWTEEPGVTQSTGSQRVSTTEQLTHTFL